MRSRQAEGREGQLTIEHVLDLAVAVGQNFLPLGPARTFGLGLGMNGGLAVLRLYQHIYLADIRSCPQDFLNNKWRNREIELKLESYVAC